MNDRLERYLLSALNGEVNSQSWDGNFHHKEIDTIARIVRSIVKIEMGYQNVQTLSNDFQFIENETIPPNTIVMKQPKK